MNKTLGQKQEVFTYNMALLICYAEENGYKCRIREAQRTQYQQDEYLRTGKTKISNSQHVKSLAVDIYFTRYGKVIEKKEDLQKFGDYWEKLNNDNRWGGNWTQFQDCPHFEMRD